MQSRQPRGLWLAIGGAAVVAGAAGFGLARLTLPPPAPAGPEATATTAKRVTSLVVPPDHLATMQIAVERVQPGAFTGEVNASGVVASTPQGEALVTAQAAGTVVRIARQLGDQVRAGEVLAQVASREAAAMAADRSAAMARAALARTRFEREQRLYDQRVSPRQDLEAAQAELRTADAEVRRARAAAATAHVGADGRTLTVVSPISGRITTQPAQLGAFVQADTELFRVADPRFAQIEASLSGADAQRVRPGDSARVTAAGAVASATVRSVTPTLDPTTRAATVLLTLNGGERPLTPGEAVQVVISPKAAGPAGIVVPDEAVQSIDGRDTVFLRTPTGFDAKTVTVSGRSGGRAAIASGLEPGQSIATRNAFLLKAELTKGAEGEE